MYGLIRLRQSNYGRDDDKSKKNGTTEDTIKGNCSISVDGSITISEQDDYIARSSATGETPEQRRDEECLFIPIANLLDVYLKDDNELVIHFTQRDKEDFYNFNLFIGEVTFVDSSHRSLALERLTAALRVVRAERPSKIFVILNPKAGWGKGEQIFDKVAAPILALGGVEYEKVVVTPGQDIVEIIAAKENLERDFDGILTAGGDGTHAAIFNGLVVKALRDAGDECKLDIQDPDFPLLDVSVGILPIGSGNLLSMKLNMTHDVQSCVVNLILGRKRKIDLVSCHDMDRQCKFVRVAALIVSATTFNAAMGQLEKFRFLGPFRYLLFIAVCIFGMKPLAYESFRIKKKAPYQPSKCFVDESYGRLGQCDRADGCREPEVNHLDVSSDWTEMTGVDKNLVGQLLVSKQEMLFPVRGVTNSKPTPHLSDGLAVSRITRSVKFSRIFKFLFIWYSDPVLSSGSRLPHTATSWMTEFIIELTDSTPLQFDGEVVAMRHVYGKVHRAVAEAFGTGAIRGHPEPYSSKDIWGVRKMLIKIFSALLGALVLAGFLIRFLWTILG